MSNVKVLTPTVLTPKEQEAQFQWALEMYWATNNTCYKKIVYERVLEACKAMAKRMLKVSLDDDVFYDRLMEAMMTCIHYILEEHKNKYNQTVPPTRPRNLVTFVALPVKAAFFGPKAIKEDQTYSYEMSIENGYDKAVNILGYEID